MAKIASKGQKIAPPKELVRQSLDELTLVVGRWIGRNTVEHVLVEFAGLDDALAAVRIENNNKANLPIVFRDDRIYNLSISHVSCYFSVSASSITIKQMSPKCCFPTFSPLRMGGIEINPLVSSISSKSGITSW